jgi:hypothetical protein
VKLVAVAIAAQDDRVVARRDPEQANCDVAKGRELVGPAAVGAPEVELARDVADEEDVVVAVAERQAARETAVGHEALERSKRRSLLHRCHAARRLQQRCVRDGFPECALLLHACGCSFRDLSR